MAVNTGYSQATVCEVGECQAEIGRPDVARPKHYADLSALHYPTIRVHIVMTFLGKFLCPTRDDLSSRVFRTLASDDIYRISVVEQCQFLESEFGTPFTD